MNIILENKLKELKNAEDKECWYIVKQPTAFASLCYLVSFLEEFKSKEVSENLQDFISAKVNEIKNSKSNVEISNNYRALRVAAFFGLITLTSSKYDEAVITETFKEITSKCSGEYENIESYIDVVQRQVEKMFISSQIDEEYNGVRQDYRLYPVMLLYKVLVEMGLSTGKYKISMTEYRYLVATTKTFEDFLETLLLIKLLREDSSASPDFEKYKTKFDNRMIQALKQLPTLVIDRDGISIKDDAIAEVVKKVFIFEGNPNIFTTENYLGFLGSTQSLFELDDFEKQNNKFVNPDEMMQLDNQKFVFACIDLMKENDLLTVDNLRLLSDKDMCAAMFKHNNYHGILFKLDSEINENEQKNGQDGRPRYYTDDYDINGMKYAVSSQWRPVTDSDDSRTPFINWIIEQLQGVRFETGYKSDFARNRILFGAPGTGKSFKLNKDRMDLLGTDADKNYERVTFHPDYSYANFVGTYKPIPTKDRDGNETITYEYVPGPFMRVYVNALKSGKNTNPKPYLLIIEEINRANVAAVFGDVFQLLDRVEDASEYPITPSQDMKEYLAKPENLGGIPDDYNMIKIPDNMFIWATMNSADQGVFPMDTAFKRRWDFKYLGIDDNDDEICGKYVFLADDKSQKVEWNKLRKAINNFLAKEKINEDKQLGPYFISRNIIVPAEGNEINRDRFIHTFKNKVIMYLFEDAGKQKKSKLFEGCFQNCSRYSEICKEFESKGVGIFNHDIQIECEVEDIKVDTNHTTE